MGVTIEQYRARIGSHNNVGIKKYSTQLEGNFSYIMLMLFQLVINIIVLIILMQVFHLCILCLPTQKLAEHIACFSQAIVSCTQMSCYIVYVPLLLRMANDIEENPGPTVYDVVDPSETVSADFNQADTKF
jgi:hypothetical protein